MSGNAALAQIPYLDNPPPDPIGYQSRLAGAVAARQQAIQAQQATQEGALGLALNRYSYGQIPGISSYLANTPGAPPPPAPAMVGPSGAGAAAPAAPAGPGGSLLTGGSGTDPRTAGVPPDVVERHPWLAQPNGATTVMGPTMPYLEMAGVLKGGNTPQARQQAIANRNSILFGLGTSMPWESAIQTAYQRGYLTQSEAAYIADHPEMAQRVLNGLASPDANLSASAALARNGLRYGQNGGTEVDPAAVQAAGAKTAAESAGKVGVEGIEAPDKRIFPGNAGPAPSAGGARAAGIVAPYDENDPRNAAALASIKDPATRQNVQAAARAQNVSLPALVALGMNENLGDPDSGAAAVGKAGEIGGFQIKPGTGQDMGYSAKLLRNPAINAQAGAQYLRQQIDAGGDVEGGIQGYNSGSPTKPAVPGYVDKWRAAYNGFGPAAVAPAGAQPAPAPGAGAAGAQPQPNFVRVQLPDGSYTYQPTGAAQAAIAGAEAAAKAPIENNQKLMNADIKHADEAADVAIEARDQQINAQKIGELASGVATGKGAQFVAALGGWLQRLGVSGPLLKELDGINPADAEQLGKYLTRATTDVEKGVTSRGGYNITRLLADSLPNLQTRPDAIQHMVNLIRVGTQLEYEINNGAVESNKQQVAQVNRNPAGDYKTVPQYYAEQNARYPANVVVASANLLSGDDLPATFKGLNAKQRQDAIALAFRANPAATIGGHAAPTAAQ
jgi:hypothetical protein